LENFCFADTYETPQFTPEFKLEQYLPYASVDPALKHILREDPSTSLFESPKLKKKIFPDPPEDNFSDIFSSISERIKTNEKTNANPSSPAAAGGLKGLILSIKTMPKELR